MKSTVLLMIAVGCGLVAAVGVYQFIQQSSARAVPIRPVVVTTAAININEPFDEDNIRVDMWPQDKVPMGAVGSLKELKDKYARTRLFKGEVILPGKVMDADGISGAVKIPPGYRVVSVKATPESSVSNLIEPGDRVDVVVVINLSQFKSNAVAKTILNAVRVFAVNREMDRTLEETKSPESARTVSLLLQPDQVERLMMAAKLGEIRLALRSPDDPRVEATAGCTVRQVLGQADVADDLGSDGMLTSLSRERDAAEWSESEGPVWTMVLMTPRGQQKYHWSDDAELPEQESPPAAPPAPASEPQDDPQDEAEEDSVPAVKPIPLEVARFRKMSGFDE